MRIGRLVRIVSVAAVLFGTCAPLWSAELATNAQPAAPTLTSTTAASAMDVEFVDGKLLVKAEGVDLVLLLRRVGWIAGVSVEISDGVKGTVNVAFQGLPLEDGVARILEAADAKDYAAVYERAPSTGLFRMRGISVVRKGAAGTVVAPNRFQWPPKKKATLKSSGKEIEYFKGWFVIKPGPNKCGSSEKTLRMSFEDRVRYLESAYPIRRVKSIAGRDFLYQREYKGKALLFEAIGDVDEVELLRKIGNDERVAFASLYGMGKESAVLSTDEKGRYRILDEEEENRLDKALEGKGEAGQKQLMMEAKPWLKQRCWPQFGNVCTTFVEGQLSFLRGADRIQDRDALEDKVLEIANDFGGILLYRTSCTEGVTSFGIVFPQVQGEDIYALMEKAAARGFPTGIDSWWMPLRSNDPYVQSQWALTTIDASAAWSTWDQQTPQRTVDVAVVDSGIGLPPDNDHPGQFLALPHADFYNTSVSHTINLSWAKDFSGDLESSALADLVDTYGHGTMVAGIIAAVGGNGIGIDGVAYSRNTRTRTPISVVPVRYTKDSKSANKESVIDALTYVRTMRLPVVNLSLTTDEIWDMPEFVRDIYGYGGVIVAAGPNVANILCNSNLDHLTELFRSQNKDAFSEHLPNAKSLFDKMIMVTSTADNSDAIDGACSSSPLLDVAAPGKNILSLRAFNLMVPDNQLPSDWSPCPECIDASGQPDLGYMKGRGTSYATPHVSATAALILAMGGITVRDAWVSQEKAYSAIPGRAHPLAGQAYGRLDMASTMNAIDNDTTPPAAPTGLGISREAAPPDSKNNPRQATELHWDPPADESGNPPPDLYRYKVYRSEQAVFHIGSETFLCYTNEPQLTQIDEFIAKNDHYYYRVTAVDRAGNESQPTEAASTPSDFVFMVSRGSRWVNPRLGYEDTYYDSVKKLVGSLAEMVPNGSRVGVLVFREKVFSENASLRAVDGAAEQGQRRTWSGDFAIDALKIPLGTLPNGKPEPWRKDYWYLDLAEVLVGDNGDVSGRATQLQPQGASNALTLLKKDGRNKVGILISDLYDNSLVGSTNPPEQKAAYEAWNTSMTKAADLGDGYDLKSVILHSQDRFPYGTMEEYLTSLSVDLNTLNKMITAIGESGRKSDVKLLKWNPTGVYDTSVLRELTHCRDSLLNVASTIRPGEMIRVPLHLDRSIEDVGILLYGAGLSHRLIRPDGRLVDLELVGGVWRSRDPLVYYHHFEDMGWIALP